MSEELLSLSLIRIHHHLTGAVAEEIETFKIYKLNQYHNVPPDRFIPFAWHIRRQLTTAPLEP